MGLTEKGKATLKLIQQYFPDSIFTVAELSKQSKEKVYAATLNGIVTCGFLEKLESTPLQYKLVDNLEELLELEKKQNAGCDNSNLHSAKKEKNNEFYTRIEDIEKEVFAYRRQFRDKKVFLNCNDTEQSAFWQYFMMNFDLLELASLTAISYNVDGHGEMIWVDSDLDRKNGIIDDSCINRKKLFGNGDFRSEESQAVLMASDIVVTNPPFSEFRDYIDILIKSNKQFLVIGSQNAYTYQEIFKLIKDNKIWPGANAVHDFKTPSGAIQKFGNICWFTNMPVKYRNEPVILTATYYNDIEKRELYPFYDTYDAINVDKVVNIPNDYFEKMGVPISFLNKYCPDQFEILGLMASTTVDEYNFGYPFIDGIKKYARIIIRRK